MTTKTGEVIASSIAEFSATESALARLNADYRGAKYEVTTTAGMRAAIEARRELRELRVSLEAKRKELKAPVLERGRLIDDEAKRITSELTALEEPIDNQIKAEEQRKADEKAAKARAEAERIEKIQRRISDIHAQPAALTGKASTDIAAKLEELQQVELAPDMYEEYIDQAKDALSQSVEKIASMLEAQRAHEAEQARIAAEREELARLRAAEEQRAAEARRAEEQRLAEERRLETERRAAADAEAAAERARLEAEARARIEQEEAERAERRRREDEERAVAAAAAERDRRAAAEERARLEAEHLRNVTLYDAARSGFDLLVELGQADHLVTRALQAALERE